MKILDPQFDIEAFWGRLARASGPVLFLDYDGTLAPFQVERDGAFPYPGVPELINTIMARRFTRVVLISGRTIDGLIPLIRLRNMPEIWGSHGWEHLRADGTVELPILEEHFLQGLEDSDKIIEKKGLLGQHEKKPTGRAVHWRGCAPEVRGQIDEEVRPVWSNIATEIGLELKLFDGGLELRIPGRDKGYAVRTTLEFLDDAVAAYLGDDLTDEDAFAAIKGRGAAILVREESRDTVADAWIRPPDELLDFLSKWDRMTSDGPP